MSDPATIHDPNAAAPSATDTTFHTDMRAAPPFLMNRRNRSQNRAKVDKFQRNQRAVRILRNAFKRGVEGISDTRIDVGDRDTYASVRPIYRGVKQAVREEDRQARIAENMHFQRIREHIWQEETEALLARINAADVLDIQAANAESRAIGAKYHRQDPVTPYANRGPQSDYLNKTGNYK